MNERLYSLSGLIPPDVCQTLYAQAGCVASDQAIVEVGSYRGKSTCCLAAGARDGFGAHVYAIDPWDTDGNETGRFGYATSETREAFHRQVASLGLTEHITAVQAFSKAAAKLYNGPPIGLLYIDGDHTYPAVKDDLLVWKRHLAERATVIFDDLDTPKNPGVRQALDELVAEGLFTYRQAGRLAIGKCP